MQTRGRGLAMKDKTHGEVTATFDDDTKRMHRFIIDEGQAVKGVLYIFKDSTIPDSITIRLRTKAEAEKAKDD
jgi:hypothetical protein